MLKYIVKRLLYSIAVILGVATIVFFLTRLTGDPVAIMLSPEATQEQVDALRHQMGYDQSFLRQYLIYMNSLLHFDFGASIRYHTPAFLLIMERLPATLKLAGISMALSLTIAIPVGIFSALKRGTWIDQGIMALAMAGQAMPVFWVGILLIMLFSVRLGWLPTGGYGDGNWKYLIMPAFALGLRLMALVARLLRSSLIEVMGADYIRTARSKGMREKLVLCRHALRNSLLPIVTVVGLQMGALLGGSVVTETVFAWPGVGQLLVQAITNRDFPVVQAAIILLAVVFIIINLVVDILYIFIDPRISY